MELGDSQGEVLRTTPCRWRTPGRWRGYAPPGAEGTHGWFCSRRAGSRWQRSSPTPGTNEMGEVPILDDGERRLTQSGVILTYLAEKHKAFGGQSEEERLEVLRSLLFDNHKFTSYFASYRFMKAFGPSAPDAAVMNWLRGRLDNAFGIVNKHLSGRAFMVGQSHTIADISLSGYLFYPIEESGYEVRDRFPNIASWLERLRDVPGWADPYEILPGERIAVRW
jgi:glutathione S-transferase